MAYSFNLVIENLLISTPHISPCDFVHSGFNLVIENLLISTFRLLSTLPKPRTHCFNLVIENLLISTSGKFGARYTFFLFQSRNRESSYFNGHSHRLRVAAQCEFQSRNRESSYFNLRFLVRGLARASGFNLVIENLLISTAPYRRSYRTCFNL